MNPLISTGGRRLAWALLTFACVFIVAIWFIRGNLTSIDSFTDTQLMTRLFGIPAVLAALVLALISACVSLDAPGSTTSSIQPLHSSTSNQTQSTATASKETKPFTAQVVGIQWLNPLQRKDYPTEWQLLWTLGLVQPNKNDDMVREDPKTFSTLQAIGIIASSAQGDETFKGYHRQFLQELVSHDHDIYFSSSKNFYNAHDVKRNGWRELAGIHVEYALPEGRLDLVKTHDFVVKMINDGFEIGNPHSPNLWSRNTPPDVHITMGGPNAGFTSLAAGLDYLQSHPKETVWVMNWDAPSFPGKDKQINENIVQLVLAGPDYKTEREPLAWIGYPASQDLRKFSNKPDEPANVQAWSAVMQAAAANANKQTSDIGYVIHDAGNNATSGRAQDLLNAVSAGVPAFDVKSNTFDTPALLGNMGAGTALTNVALAIGYANHFGKNVLVAGTTDINAWTGVTIVPPAKVRPIDPNKDWFRARGENHVFLPWWGLRYDSPPVSQGYSY